MSLNEIRQKLHNAVDEIDNEELLKAMLTILVQGNSENKKYQLTADQIQLLEEREAEYRTGKDKGVTFEEFKKKMDKKYGV